jgi:hypothetical protein
MSSVPEKVAGHAAICTILRNTASHINALRVAVEAVGTLFERHILLAVAAAVAAIAADRACPSP